VLAQGALLARGFAEQNRDIVARLPMLINSCVDVMCDIAINRERFEYNCYVIDAEGGDAEDESTSAAGATRMHLFSTDPVTVIDLREFILSRLQEASAVPLFNEAMQSVDPTIWSQLQNPPHSEYS